PPLHGMDLLWMALLAFVCTVFAHGYHIHLLRQLDVYTANLAVNLEPVYGILAAAALFGEHRTLHPGFFVGAATTIAANVAHPLLQRAVLRRKRVSPH
ncbi:MAG: EamA family transporter, partial [Verrucomicrobiae bacterium]|nr:EamA family transporter [Verrucomicrobiae bacterium]